MKNDGKVIMEDRWLSLIIEITEYLGARREI